MRITTLNIYNYKNLSIELRNSSSIIALIGNNGSGKSNILEAISTIFFHLFSKKEKDIPFNFKLEYTYGGNQNVLIEKNHSSVKYKVNEIDRSDAQQVLPKQIIALYSGEENRLWTKSYQPLYMNYISNISKSETSGLGEYSVVPKMLYINKRYWHISLLCLLLSDAPDTKKFCEETLGINKINSIKFDFNTANYANYSDSSVKAFINIIDKKSDYTISELKEIFSESPYTLDIIFKFLYLAFTPDKKKMLENITIKYNDENLDIEDFSEGEKKMLLIKAALEYAGLEDSLFLLDEPDAHIHLSNKIQIKNVFKEYLATRQVILTTHSPTLTDTLEDDSLYMLNAGKLITSKKQEILENVSGEFWNKFQQNSFIASKKPIILLVEGKHDKEHITNAFEILHDEYPDISFEIFKLNTETNIKPFLRGLYESEFDNTKIYIGLFDREAKILDDFKNKKNYTRIEGKEYYKILESDKPNTNYFVTALPKLEDKKCDCSIEIMYDYSKWEEAYQKAVQNTIGKTANKSIKTFAEDVLCDAKNIMSEYSKSFNKADFKNFKLLFNLIREIKEYSDKNKKNTNVALSSNISTIPKEVVMPEEINGYATAKEMKLNSNNNERISAKMSNISLETSINSTTNQSLEINKVDIEEGIEIFTTHGKTDVNAIYYKSTGHIIIQPGSTIANSSVPSTKDAAVLKRLKYIKLYCEQKDNRLLVTQEIRFTSPFAAIEFATGSHINGWDYWKIKANGETLQSIRYLK